MTRKMFDSTTAADVPAGSELVAGYVDGSHAWSAADWTKFQGRTLVRLGIFNDRWDAQVLDVEPGNCDSLAAVSWVRGKWLRGDVPTVYCFSDKGPTGYTISDVRAACDAASVKRPLILIAEWDNDPSTFDPSGDPEIIGKQYANSDLTGGHYDASVVADYWPGVDAMVSQADFDAFKADVKSTIEAMKAAYDPLVHHKHAVTPTATTITLLPEQTSEPQ